MRFLALLFCLISIPAFAQTQIQNLPPVGSLTGTETFPLDQDGITKQATFNQMAPAALDKATGAVTGAKGLVGRIGTNTYTLVTTLSGLCGSVLTGDQCTAIFGFADPRNYGGFCDVNFNANSNFHSDEIGIQAALNNTAKAMVVIPLPGCKIAAGVFMTGDGQSVFSFPHAASYDMSYNVLQPYIFLPNNLAVAISATALTNVNNTGTRCAISINGWDGLAFTNLDIRGNFNVPGTTFGLTALCNGYDQFFDPASSLFHVQQGVGVQCRGAGCSGTHSTNMTTIEHVGIGEVGIAIGGVTDGTTCVPNAPPGATTGYPGASYWQVQGHDLKLANNCEGTFFNESDSHWDDLYLSSNKGPGFSTVPAFSGMARIMMSNVRCEQSFGKIAPINGTDDTDGACMNIESSMEITNLECDNSYGSCLRTGTSTGDAEIFGFTSNRSGAGSTTTSKCAIVLNGSSHVNITGMVATGSPQPAHVLCTLGTVDDVVVDGSFSGGSSGSYLSLANPVTHFKFDVPEMTHFVTGDAVEIGTQTATPANSVFNIYGGHLTTQQAAVPVASSCGGGATAAASTDHAGTVSGLTTATSCTLTFSSAWDHTPSCHPDVSVTGITDKYVSSVSTLAVTFTFTSMTGSLYYWCM